MPEALRVSVPASGAPDHLFLLFHGVGADAAGLVPLGRAIARAFPQAAVYSVPAAFPFDAGGAGRQWFSIRGVTEENRAQRVAGALPHFAQAVRELQQRHGLDAARTTLVGFSQGAIVSLEAARQGQALADRVASIAGRFAQPPTQPLAARSFHFLHGELDGVIPFAFARQAAQATAALGAAATLDLFPDAGHGLTPAMEERLLQRLSTAA
ncbi:esterase [Ramlibacter humi]|uniref:Esterase n=1 Tax=Ramlibacter humi TaxID=2530451 RepID=A0A4Z0CAL7_9BURK|nr:esterase [Ramlibacter humi]TFZ07952.1 esterase [Ramlibacter humi]